MDDSLFRAFSREVDGDWGGSEELVFLDTDFESGVVGIIFPGRGDPGSVKPPSVKCEFVADSEAGSLVKATVFVTELSREWASEEAAFLGGL